MRAGTTAADDRSVGRFPLLARLAALRQHASRTTGMSAARGTSFAAAHRVADRVHRRAAVVWFPPKPTLAARLANADVHVVRIANYADGGAALGTDAAHFAGRQRDLRPVAFTGSEGRRRTSAAAELAASARLHFQIVDGHTQRNSSQRQTIAHARLHFLAADDLVARLEIFRSQDVALFAVVVLQQGDARRAIGIVFDCGD